MAHAPSTERYPRHESGTGLPVVFLHGIFGSPENFRVTSERLSDQYRIICLALPIFDLPPRRCTVGVLCQYVEAFISEACLDRPVLVGNSLGGHIALHLALEQPEGYRGLVLAGSSGLFERGFERGVPINPNREWLAGRLAKSIFHNPANLTDEMIDEAMELLSRRENRLRLLRIASSAKRDNLGDVLHHVAAPTCLVWGREDTVTPLDVAERFLTSLPHAELAVIDECGHAPMLEQPLAFARAVERFLAGLKGSPVHAAAS